MDIAPIRPEIADDDRISLVTLDPGRLLGLILENAYLGVALLTLDLHYVLVNQRAADFVGRPRAEFLGRHCSEMIGRGSDHAGGDAGPQPCDAHAALQTTAGRMTTELHNFGEHVTLQVQMVPLTDDSGVVCGFLQLLENVAEKMIDPLTGAHNYRHYLRTMEQEASRSTRHDTPLSLLTLDANNFKSVNDQFGHIRGDEVLHRIAETLAHTVRESDHLCRIGGDEFAIIAPHTNHREAESLAGRVRDAVATAFGDLDLTMAVGIASYPEDTRHPDALRGIADARLYRDKFGRAL